MKKIIGLSLFTLTLSLFLVAYNVIEKETAPGFVSNPKLITVYPDSDWKGTPLDKKGKFTNLYSLFDSNFGDLLKWQLSKNPQKKEKKQEQRRLKVEFDSLIFENTEDYLIWIGHATYLMQIDGKVILTDPMVFDNTFLKRECELPFPLEKLPRLDYLLLSHDHRDHLDKKSIQYLTEKNPNLKILTGLGMEKTIESWIKGISLQEAGWFQQYNLLDSNLEITFVPSRHWSRRGLWDLNETLWGGFFIKSGKYSIYFMGDSGSGPHFEDIKSALGPPDYCLMGVGAFKPEWFMEQVHISPYDAIQVFNNMEGAYFIPMHFGTFDLSDEPRMEPWDILVKNKDQINGELIEPILGKNLLRAYR